MADEPATTRTAPAVVRADGRPLRVGHLTTVDMSLWLLLATELAHDVEQGFEVVALSAPGPWVARVEGLGVRHVALPSLTRSWRPRNDARAARELARVLRSLDLDVLHTHNPKTGVLGRVLGRVLRVPVVVNTCHGLWAAPGDPAGVRAAVLAVEALAGRFSHAELYQNDTDRQALAGWVRRGRQRTVGNGIDLLRFQPDAGARRRVRAELGVDEDTVLVGGVGRLVREKGVVELAHAAQQLRGRARFVWIGPRDEDKPDALLGEVEGLELLGPRDDVRDVYSALDVFVLPSYREGFSRSGMEAAACGVASVLTDIRGCRELGVHEDSLLLVPPSDAEALRVAVERLIDDQVLRARLGRAARETALRRFDQRQVAEASVRTYVDVARRRGLGWQVCS